MSTPSETQLRTANSVINGYNAWTLETILAPRAPECVHEMLPESLGIPPSTNDEYAEHLKEVIPMLKDTRFQIQRVENDTESRKAVVHVRPQADSDSGSYDTEYVFSLTFTEDRKQVSKVEMVVDTAHWNDFWPKPSKKTKGQGQS